MTSQFVALLKIGAMRWPMVSESTKVLVIPEIAKHDVVWGGVAPPKVVVQLEEVTGLIMGYDEKADLLFYMPKPPTTT